MKAELNMKEVELSWLKPADYNPRADLQPGDPEYEKIKRSIENFTYVDPIIANSDGTIIGGHQRLKVLLDLGYTSADVVIVDKDKNEEAALNIALNKISGDWNPDKLAEVIGDIDVSDLDATLTGFDEDEIKELVGKINIPDKIEEDDFDIDVDFGKEPTAQRGQVWVLGNHRLMCGDSSSDEDMETLMGGVQLT